MYLQSVALYIGYVVTEHEWNVSTRQYYS